MKDIVDVTAVWIGIVLGLFLGLFLWFGVMVMVFGV